MFILLPAVVLGLALHAPRVVPHAATHPLPVVTIRAHDFAFSAPSRIKAGTTTFRLVNEGKQLHHATVIHLASGKSAADYVTEMKKGGPPPEWATEVGGPNAAPPGTSSEAMLTLDAGDYLLVCFVASPGSPMPHLMKGMMRPFTVMPAKSRGEEPAADVQLTLSDYTFALSKPITAGRHIVHVTNDATQAHEIAIIQLAPGKTIGDVAAWVDADMKGPPPGKPVTGMSPLAHGRSATFATNLSAGRYGMICFVPDARDGKRHYAHGMQQEFSIQ